MVFPLILPLLFSFFSIISASLSWTCKDFFSVVVFSLYFLWYCLCFSLVFSLYFVCVCLFFTLLSLISSSISFPLILLLFFGATPYIFFGIAFVFLLLFSLFFLWFSLFCPSSFTQPNVYIGNLCI